MREWEEGKKCLKEEWKNWVELANGWAEFCLY
jgi:hypothetical protein